jgi:hypothetical protein
MAMLAHHILQWKQQQTEQTGQEGGLTSDMERIIQEEGRGRGMSDTNCIDMALDC